MTFPLTLATGGPPPHHNLNSASRWAALIIRAIDCPDDPRSLMVWGRLAGASVATLRARCAAIDTSPKASLDFARLLRVIVMANGSPWDPSAQLDILDLRTVRRLLVEGGLAELPEGVATPSIKQFFDRQRLVRHEDALGFLAKKLTDRGLR